jgi:hypothetical protein
MASDSWGVGRVVAGVDCCLFACTSASVVHSNKQRVVVGIDRVMASTCPTMAIVPNNDLQVAEGQRTTAADVPWYRRRADDVSASSATATINK